MSWRRKPTTSETMDVTTKPINSPTINGKTSNKQQTITSMQTTNYSSTTTKTISSKISSIDAESESLGEINAIKADVTVTKKSKKKASDATGKRKSKKSKKSDVENENISVRSSFSKFDSLEKKNADKTLETISDANVKVEPNCRACGKVVYKMEEIKAERGVWHRNCFRCNECCKPLSVDSYQSHEGVVYCKPHFRLLFAPKAVDDNEPVKPRKPEMIIRENQPAELPPDVVRASDKPDLGLEDLQQLNVRERFQVFEHYKENSSNDKQKRERSPTCVKRSQSVLLKAAKFQGDGLKQTYHHHHSDLSESDVENENADDDDIDDNDEDADLIRAKRAQRERPVCFRNMNDIKSKFENGHMMSREERREETKQEIQNIRSRLFMGKQARIKEMYQQAVADSEQAITSTGKKPEIEIGDKARTLKEKFEKGEIFVRNENDEHKLNDEEMEVFEQGISKQSRSIFQNLDASQNHQAPVPQKVKRTISLNKQQQQLSVEPSDVIKSTDKSDDIKIETSEISSKFKFFEQYRPTETQRKPFRITPPRDGVVKNQSPEPDMKVLAEIDDTGNDQKIVERSHTTTKMLSLFRQMEDAKSNDAEISPLKPLKRFTPPPDGNRRVYDNESDDDDGDDDDDEYDDEEGGEEETETVDTESDEDTNKKRYDDEFLRQAQSAARAKQLCAKFEKWEANEIKRELNNSSTHLYESYPEQEDGQVESAKSLRAKFEALRDSSNRSTIRPQVQVNRFL